MTKVIGLNDDGRRVGQDHHRARFTDHEVELMRQMRDSNMSFYRIARIMECGESTVRDICNHRRRAQVPTKFKKVTS